MKRRYGVAITAAVLAFGFAGAGRAADPSIEQLQVIASLLEANDVQALREYLGDRPELLEGDSDLSLLLSQYMAESDDIVAFLGLPSEPLRSEPEETSPWLRNEGPPPAPADREAALSDPSDSLY